MFIMYNMLMLCFMIKLKKGLNTLSSFPFITYCRVVYFRRHQKSYDIAVHLHLQQMTHISLDDRKSIIVLCDLCSKIHVIYVFPIIRTYLLMLEHSDKRLITYIDMISPVNLSLKWENINKIATESIALVLTPENHHKSHAKSLP